MKRLSDRTETAFKATISRLVRTGHIRQLRKPQFGELPHISIFFQDLSGHYFVCLRWRRVCEASSSFGCVLVSPPELKTRSSFVAMPNTKIIHVSHLWGIDAAYQMPHPYDPLKPTMVLVNSFGTSSELYQPQFQDRDITDTMNLLAIEPLGHG